MPFTHAMPMRSPVNDPGPFHTAKASISSSFIPVVFKRLSTIGMSVWLCVNPEFVKYSPVMTLSVHIAALADTADESSAKILKLYISFYFKCPVVFAQARHGYLYGVFRQGVFYIFAPLNNEHAVVNIIEESG